MEKDKYISLADSYIKIGGSRNALTELTDAIQDGNVEFVLCTKNPHRPISPSVKLTKKNSKKLFPSKIDVKL